jgi:hypothetical protein
MEALTTVMSSQCFKAEFGAGAGGGWASQRAGGTQQKRRVTACVHMAPYGALPPVEQVGSAT